jgi:transcriptional regulator with XRE-family HTH domain
MLIFAKNLQNRAEELGLPHAEVARRVGLSERRYAHYVSGRNEPDLALLVKIAEVLRLTPNDLLGVGTRTAEPSKRTILQDRLLAAAKVMKDADLEAAAIQAEAVVKMRKKST